MTSVNAIFHAREESQSKASPSRHCSTTVSIYLLPWGKCPMLWACCSPHRLHVIPYLDQISVSRWHKKHNTSNTKNRFRMGLPSNIFSRRRPVDHLTPSAVSRHRLYFLLLAALPRSLREGLETPTMHHTAATIQGRYPSCSANTTIPYC